MSINPLDVVRKWSETDQKYIYIDIPKGLSRQERDKFIRENESPISSDDEDRSADEIRKELKEEIKNPSKIPEQMHIYTPQYAPTLNSSIPKPQISPFDLALDENTGTTTVLIGPSKKGKTTLLMHIFDRYYSGSDFISVLFTDSGSLPIYSGKRLIVVNSYQPEMIKDAKKINDKTRNYYNFCFMFDDIVDLRGKKEMVKSFLTYRNANISSVLSIQDETLIDRTVRRNVHNIIMFEQNEEITAQTLIEKYLKSYLIAMGIKSKDDQLSWYRLATQNHGFIYINTQKNKCTVHRL